MCAKSLGRPPPRADCVSTAVSPAGRRKKVSTIVVEPVASRHLTKLGTTATEDEPGRATKTRTPPHDEQCGPQDTTARPPYRSGIRGRGRPPERRQIHPHQRADRHADRHRLVAAGDDAQGDPRCADARQRADGALLTPPASTARAHCSASASTTSSTGRSPTATRSRSCRPPTGRSAPATSAHPEPSALPVRHVKNADGGFTWKVPLIAIVTKIIDELNRTELIDKLIEVNGIKAQFADASCR